MCTELSCTDIMNNKYKITNKFSNESLHSLLDHELHISQSGSNFVRLY